MQITSLFLALGAFASASCSSFLITDADKVPCVPSTTPNTCILNYNTESGTPVDTAHPEGISANVFIYSHSCFPLGHQIVTVPGEGPMMFWGASLKHPLILGSEKRPDKDWWSPWFKYNNRRYSLEDCSCEGTSCLGTSHKCTCHFQCQMFVID